MMKKSYDRSYFDRWYRGRNPVVEPPEIGGSPFCVHGLKKHLSRLPGAKHVDVTLGTGEAVVTFAPGSTVTEAQIRAAVKRAGFTTGKIEWREASS